MMHIINIIIGTGCLILNFLMCVGCFYFMYLWYKSYSELIYLKPEYEKLKKQYLELHEQFYEPVFTNNEVEGRLEVDFKLKDKT